MDSKPQKRWNARDIAALYRDKIAAGEYAPGRPLPPAKGVAKEFGVALQTAQNAYKQLEADGLVEGRRGSGTYVIDPVKGAQTAQEAAASLRDLQGQLKKVTSQLSQLSDRVADLEGAVPRVKSPESE